MDGGEKLTKKKMIEAMQKTTPYKSIGFMMKWPIDEVRRGYELGKKAGAIK